MFLVTPQYLRTITGSGGLYALELSRELAVRNFSVTVLTPLVGRYPPEETVVLEVPGAGRSSRKGKVKIRRLPVSDSPSIRNAFEGNKETEIKRLQEFKAAVLNYLRSETGGKCIVHLNGHFMIPSLARDLKPHGRFRTVTSIHSLDSIVETRKENPVSKYILDYIQEREKEALLFSGQVIFSSPSLKEEAAWMYPDEFGKSRIRVIPPGITKGFMKRENVDPEKAVLLKEKYRLSDHFLFYLGRIDEPKGLEYLISSFPRLVEKLKERQGAQYQKLTLLIAGLLEKKNQPYYEKLTRLVKTIRNREIRESISIFADPSVIIDKEALIQLASVFVLPLVVAPFGLSLIEAVIKETPFVASGVEGIMDILSVRDLKSPFRSVSGGAVVEYSNPFQRAENLTEALFHVISRYPAFKKSVLPLGKRLSRLYGWDRLIRETIGIYQRLFR